MKKFIENFLISLLIAEESEENLCSICESYEDLQKENLELQKLYEETLIELKTVKSENAELTKANLWYTESNKGLRESKRRVEDNLRVTENYALILVAVAILGISL